MNNLCSRTRHGTVQAAITVLTVLLMATASVPLPAQSPYKLSVDIDLVSLNVSVQNRGGQPVDNLKRENFHVLEDGKPQEIAVFQAKDSPATIGLVIDNSGSMGPIKADVVQAAKTFVELGNVEDDMFVLHFNDNAVFGLPSDLPFTTNRLLLDSAIAQMHPIGRTALYDSVWTALDHLNTSTRENRFLVVFSDGGDNASRRTEAEVVRKVQESNVTVYAIGLYDTFNEDRSRRTLNRLASLTGGKAFFPSDPTELDEAWKQVASGIRNRYIVGYSPTNQKRDGKYRRLRVEVSVPGQSHIEVRTRPGYIAPLRNDER